MSEALYTAKTLSTGGGRDGHVATHDRAIDLDVRPPKELGGDGNGTNPEQLVASGWATCFNGALQLMMKNDDVKAEQKPEVEVTMTLNKGDEGMFLTATVHATIFDVDQDKATELVNKAHEFCPYSKAMRGNVPTEVTASVG